MDIPRLIDDWAQGDPQKQVAAWRAVLVAARPALRAALARWHQPRDLLDDLVQEFYVHVRTRRRDPIAALRGRTEAEFHKYLLRIAQRFANSRLRTETRHRRQEREAARGAPPGDHVSGSEAEIHAWLAEIESELTRTERETLEQLVRSVSAGLGTQPRGSENGGIHEQSSASPQPTAASGRKRRSRLLEKFRGLLFGKGD